MPLTLITPAELESACIQLFTTDGLCVVFPGGFTVCAQVGLEAGDPSEIVKSLLASLNSGMAPLTPFFNTLDVVKAVFDCIQAIPDCLSPPDPQPLLDCFPGLTEAVNKLLQLLPPFPIFVLVKGVLSVIIEGLIGLRMKLLAIFKRIEKMLRAATLAAELGNIHLQVAVDCANGNIEAQFQNLNAEMEPLNRLIGLVNALLEIAGEDCIPVLPDLSELAEDALAPLDATIELLQTILAAIPGPPQFPPSVPQPGDCA
jgi:hypothetical protein